MKYEYQIRDIKGNITTGQLEAENRDAVINNLFHQGYYLTSLKEINPSVREFKLDISFSKVKIQDLLVMTRQMSTMLASGLSILRALRIISEQTTNRQLKKTVIQVRDDIEKGQAFWQALSKHPQVFSGIYISMIKSGELGGILEPVLDRLGDHLEREQEITSKIKSASIYPCIISGFALLVVFFIITFVMPTFVNMFQTSGVELPLPTRILLNTGLFLKSYWLLIFAGILVAAYIFKKWAASIQGKYIMDRFYLRLPLLGKTLSWITVARFSRTMGTLVKSGISILQALEAVEGVVGNEVIGRAIRQARASISEGDSITGPLEATGVFEPMVTQMIAIGEETGSLDEMLIRMSDYFDRQVMYMVDSMMAVVEPLMIVMVALLVGGVVVATLLPIFEIMSIAG